MDEHGEATGTVTMTYRGAPALSWRQLFLRGDDTSLKHDLQTAMEKMMPGGMDVKVNSIQKLEDYEQPLVIVFDIKGQIASSTGKRLLVPGDIFEVNAKQYVASFCLATSSSARNNFPTSAPSTASLKPRTRNPSF